MSKKIILASAIALALFAVPAMAVTVVGSGSGYLLHNFSNATYTDIAEVSCANFTLVTDYNPTDVTRTFEIRDTYFYAQSGMYGTSPNPGVLDWGRFTSTEAGTGTWAYNDLSYEKTHAQYAPAAGTVHADSFVDFTAQTADVYNYVAAAGERVMTQEVGSPTLSSSYNNTVWSHTPGTNAGVKLETNATFGGNTIVNGHGAYSPFHLNVNLQNTDGLEVWNTNQTPSPPPATGSPNSYFNALGIYHAGNAYIYDFTGAKGSGFYFNINN